MTVRRLPPERPEPPIALAAIGGDLVLCTVVPEERDGAVLAKGIEYQCELVFRNLADTLAKAGSAMASVLHVTVYLVDIAHREAMTAAWRTAFPGEPPARATIGVNQLADPNLLVEISVVAARTSSA